MRKLKPSHREKKRYLVIEGKDAGKETIEKVILDYLGVLGLAKSSPQVIKKSENKLILAINREALDNVRAAFLISGKNLKISKVSGSLKNVK